MKFIWVKLSCCISLILIMFLHIYVSYQSVQFPKYKNESQSKSNIENLYTKIK